MTKENTTVKDQTDLRTEILDKLPGALRTFCTLCAIEERDNGWEFDAANPFTVPTKIALIHSEVSEALEGHRKNLQDDHLPERKAVEVELADVMIRIAGLAANLGLDLGSAVAEKIVYNASRADHKPEERAKEHGKKY